MKSVVVTQYVNCKTERSVLHITAYLDLLKIITKQERLSFYGALKGNQTVPVLVYCMPKKPCPIVIVYFLYKNEQAYLDTQKSVRSRRLN